MFKLAGLVLDFPDDTEGRILLDHADRIEKTAGDGAIYTPDELNGLPDEAFALIFTGANGARHRKYAMHDKIHTALSSAYLEECGSQLPPQALKTAAYHLLEAHVRFHLQPSSQLMALPKVAAETNELPLDALEGPGAPEDPEKQAFIPDHEFLYLKDIGGGDRERLYRVADGDQCKEAMVYFEGRHKELEPVDRVKIASALKEKAAGFSVPPVGAALEKYSSEAWNPGFESYIAMREQALGDGDPRIAVLRTLVEKKADCTPIEMAISLEAFDKESGLDFHWDKHLPDPFASTLGGAVETIKVGSHEVTLQEILKVVGDEDKVSKVFGPEKLADFRSDPERTFFALPPGIQEALLDL